MKVLVNGELHELPEHATVQTVVPESPGLAVAVNGSVVRRADWASTGLHEDDRVEVVTAHQGG